MPDDVKRRDLFRMTAGGLLLVQTGRTQTPVFFSKEEYLALDELTETIIPADDHSPGAKAAACAAFMDRQLAETTEADDKKAWRDGMKLLEAHSDRQFGKGITALTPQQRYELLEPLSRASEADAKKPLFIFFNKLKRATAFAYYSSKIGIHEEMHYKGNVPINQFVGEEPS